MRWSHGPNALNPVKNLETKGINSAYPQKMLTHLSYCSYSKNEVCLGRQKLCIESAWRQEYTGNKKKAGKDGRRRR